MKYLLIIILIFLISFIYAECSSDQIDINTATLEELDKLTGIGPVKAQAIIDERDFDNLDDLINVYGIGEKTLEKIINQDLACVEDEKQDKKGDDIEEDDEYVEVNLDEIINQEVKETKKKKPIEIIKLNSKDIKTEKDEENKEEPKKNNYAIYGLIVFSFILGFLFYIKSKQYKKNEFN